jgi:hypothetical protein
MDLMNLDLQKKLSLTEKFQANQYPTGQRMKDCEANDEELELEEVETFHLENLLSSGRLQHWRCLKRKKLKIKILQQYPKNLSG